MSADVPAHRTKAGRISPTFSSQKHENTVGVAEFGLCERQTLLEFDIFED